MKRVLSLLFVILTIALSALAKSNNMPKYDITGAGSGNEGMVLVKVFVYAKSANDQDLKRAAVHGNGKHHDGSCQKGRRPSEHA